MRILEVINRTTPFFEKQGVDSPRLTIELLLAHLLKKKRLELYLEFERELDEPALVRLREMVRRRAAGEPLQYITGETEFCGLQLAVDRRVLIPRPETELLVETVLELLAAPSTTSHPPSPIRLIDVGTGSGCIAIALATRLPAAEITATDVSADALAVARTNATRHGAQKKIRFLESDLLEGIDEAFAADAVVSNPPYISTKELATLPREVKDFEPVHALVAGEDGLEGYRRLAPSARRVLRSGGLLALELGAGQRPLVEELVVGAGFAVTTVRQDLQGHDRVLVAVVPAVSAE